MEYPILFSGEMARAILDGCKTQTRRVIKSVDNGDTFLNFDGKVFIFTDKILDIFSDTEGSHKFGITCPYGRPGDLLWVRETWKLENFYGVEPFTTEIVTIGYKDGKTKIVEIKHDNSIDKLKDGNTDGWQWRPSIFMPRWASRITLKITDVRVERLQEITPENCLAEGIDLLTVRIHKVSGEEFVVNKTIFEILKDYKKLWNSINAKRGYSWDSNPWVWVIEFKLEA